MTKARLLRQSTARNDNGAEGSLDAALFAEVFDGVPEGGEDLLVVANEDGVGTHGGEESLGAGEEGVVELDEAVVILAVVDEDEDAVEGRAEHVDLVEGIEGGGAIEVLALGVGVMAGVESVLEGVFVSFFPGM